MKRNTCGAPGFHPTHENEANLDNAWIKRVLTRHVDSCINRSYMIFDEELESEIQILQKSTFH